MHQWNKLKSYIISISLRRIVKILNFTVYQSCLTTPILDSRSKWWNWETNSGIFKLYKLCECHAMLHLSLPQALHPIKESLFLNIFLRPEITSNFHFEKPFTSFRCKRLSRCCSTNVLHWRPKTEVGVLKSIT